LNHAKTMRAAAMVTPGHHGNLSLHGTLASDGKEVASAHRGSPRKDTKS